MTPTPVHQLHCAVHGAEQLPPELGGEAGVCAAIGEALAPALSRAGIAASAVAVAIEVKSKSRISAVTSVDGKPLPEQNVAISDRSLNAGAVRMLANGLAAQISELAARPGGSSK
ncbi:MAG: hypothetical protein ACTHN4_04610 [Sphingomicrobium sp.]